jgi:RsiW-degrading membrane proteinase PrsW (M82 family)
MLAPWKLALLGAAPALVAMAVVDRMDAKRPEPPRTRRLVALAGALSAIPVYFVGQLFAVVAPELSFASGYAGVVFASFVVVALPEEATKLCGMALVVWSRPEFDERMDGIVYGARAGLGFALVENVTYVLSTKSAASLRADRWAMRRRGNTKPSQPRSVALRRYARA